jgi:hypothetical protein
MKKYLVIYLIFSSIILAEDVIDDEIINEKLKPKFEVYLRRNRSDILPSEADLFSNNFRSFRETTNIVNNYEFGLIKYFDGSNLSLGFEFREFQKGNLQAEQINCIQLNSQCFQNRRNIGTYNQISGRSYLRYELEEFSESDSFLFLNFGIRGLKTSLSDTELNNYNIKYEKESLGPTISIHLEGRSIYNLLFGGELEFYYLYGNFNQKNGFSFENNFLPFTEFSSHSKMKILGRRYNFYTGFNINKNIKLKLGMLIEYNRVYPSSMMTRSTNPDLSIQNELDYTFLGGKKFSEGFSGWYFEINLSY